VADEQDVLTSLSACCDLVDDYTVFREHESTEEEDYDADDV